MTGNGGDPATGVGDIMALALRESGTRPWMLTFIAVSNLPTIGLQTLMVSHRAVFSPADWDGVGMQNVATEYRDLCMEPHAWWLQHSRPRPHKRSSITQQEHAEVTCTPVLSICRAGNHMGDYQAAGTQQVRPVGASSRLPRPGQELGGGVRVSHS
jgi:hypothetical protein